MTTDRSLGKGLARFTVSHGQLLLTVHPEDVYYCDDCPDVHVRVLPNGTAQNVRNVGHALAHLAGHLTEGVELGE